MIVWRKECIDQLRNYGMTSAKLTHTLLVEKVAVFLARRLTEQGEKIDLVVLSRGALLHDIAKEQQKRTGRDHAEEGYKLCREMGIDKRVCVLIRKHSLRWILDGKLDTWEQKLIFYADKICKREIVGIDERFRPWLEKAVHDRKNLERAKRLTEQLENDILGRLALRLQDVKRGINEYSIELPLHDVQVHGVQVNGDTAPTPPQHVQHKLTRNVSGANTQDRRLN